MKYKLLIEMKPDMRKALGKIAKKNEVKLAQFVRMLIAEAIQKDFKVVHSSILAEDTK